jgi:hypothetical protein
VTVRAAHFNWHSTGSQRWLDRELLDQCDPVWADRPQEDAMFRLPLALLLALTFTAPGITFAHDGQCHWDGVTLLGQPVTPDSWLCHNQVDHGTLPAAGAASRGPSASQRQAGGASAVPLPIPADVRAAFEAWAAYMAPKIQLAGQALAGLGQQSAAAGHNPALVSDRDWRFTTATALALLKAAGEEMQKYAGAIPADLQPVHSSVLATGEDLERTVDEFALGVDRHSAALIRRAAERLDTVTARISGTLQDLQVLQKRYGF